MSRGPFVCGGLRLNFPEFTWLVNCSIVTDRYLFQFLKAIFSGYLLVVGEGGQVWQFKKFNVLNILSHPESSTILKMKVLRTLENAILRLVLENTSFNNTFFNRCTSRGGARNFPTGG